MEITLSDKKPKNYPKFKHASWDGVMILDNDYTLEEAYLVVRAMMSSENIKEDFKLEKHTDKLCDGNTYDYWKVKYKKFEV